MSDPAQKALGPAPVTMTQRIVSLSLHAVTAATIAFAISGVAALSLSGRLRVIVATAPSTVKRMVRSEEHTSELQSLMRISYAVFCLKKKKKQHRNRSILQSTLRHKTQKRSR